MKHWLSLISTKPVASLNTLWYFVSHHPGEQLGTITLFCDRTLRSHSAWFREQVIILLKYHQRKEPIIKEVFIDPIDIDSFRKSLKKTIALCDAPLIMDITSGRKLHSALMLLFGELNPGVVEHIYYNFLKSPQFINCVYPNIPSGMMEIVDLKEKSTR